MSRDNAESRAAGWRAAALLADRNPVVIGKTLYAAFAAGGEPEEIAMRHVLPSGRNPRLPNQEHVAGPHAHFPN